MATLTYEDLGIPAIKDFDYTSYDKVNFHPFRIGAATVAADTQAISPKVLGDRRLSALSTTLAGNKIKLLTFQSFRSDLKLQLIQQTTSSSNIWQHLLKSTRSTAILKWYSSWRANGAKKHDTPILLFYMTVPIMTVEAMSYSIEILIIVDKVNTT